MNQGPAIGDWIRAASPGVWQVHRVLSGFYELRYSLASTKRRSRRVIVFARRLVDDEWRPAFRSESCELSLTEPVSAEDSQRVETLLQTRPDLKRSFDDYRPDPIPLLVNLSMKVPDASVLRSFCEATLSLELEQGIPFDRVLQLLDQAGLGGSVGQMPSNATLQLGCRDHEVREGEFVMRDCQVLPF
jgi:hypothetical protein